MGQTRIGITHGDYNGIGYELILKTFQVEEMLSLCTPVVYGSPKLATYHRKTLSSPTNFNVIDSADMAREGALNLVNCFGDEEMSIDLGQASEEAGKAALTALDHALADLKNGKIDALVTAPVNGSVIKVDGADFEGQTAHIEKVVGEGKSALRMLVSDTLRIAFATPNAPVAEIPALITKERIAGKIVALHNTLKRDFFIDSPRIAVLALNPQCDGKEETETITPTVTELFKKGVRCVGPYAAEEFFGKADHTHFDAILAMRHDQGAEAFKTIAQGEGVSLTAALPYLRTAPLTGPCYEMAGKNEADTQSFRQAIYTAIDTARNRARFDAERENPLKKQYFDKRDDSDKLKLDQSADKE